MARRAENLDPVAATLRRAELAGRLTPERTSVALDDLLAAPQRRVQIKALVPEAWTLRHNLTVTERCTLSSPGTSEPRV